MKKDNNQADLGYNSDEEHTSREKTFLDKTSKAISSGLATTSVAGRISAEVALGVAAKTSEVISTLASNAALSASEKGSELLSAAAAKASEAFNYLLTPKTQESNNYLFKFEVPNLSQDQGLKMPERLPTTSGVKKNTSTDISSSSSLDYQVDSTISSGNQMTINFADRIISEAQSKSSSPSK